MKKLLTLLLLLSTMAAQAQTGKAASDQVAKIRARYAEAKQMMANEGEDWMTQNHVVVNATYMCPGAGPRNESIQFYFTLDEDETSDSFYSRTPYLITRSYNVAPRKFYEEYLYDAKGRLIFFYSSNDSYESEAKDESRYYWNASAKLVHQQKQGETLYSEAQARGMSDHLLQTFRMLVIP